MNLRPPSREELEQAGREALAALSPDLRALTDERSFMSGYFAGVVGGIEFSLRATVAALKAKPELLPGERDRLTGPFDPSRALNAGGDA